MFEEHEVVRLEDGEEVTLITARMGDGWFWAERSHRLRLEDPIIEIHESKLTKLNTAS